MREPREMIPKHIHKLTSAELEDVVTYTENAMAECCETCVQRVARGVVAVAATWGKDSQQKIIAHLVSALEKIKSKDLEDSVYADCMPAHTALQEYRDMIQGGGENV